MRKRVSNNLIVFSSFALFASLRALRAHSDHQSLKMYMAAKKHPTIPHTIPATAIHLPPDSDPSFVTCEYPMIPNTTASSDGTAMQLAGNPMIPSTSDATQKPL